MPSSLYSPMAVAPCRLESLARSGPMIIGRWANLGGSNPRALNNCRWRGVLGSHSSARMMWLISIKWSSATTARWYVGKPSDFMIMKSFRVSFRHSTSPRIRSSTLVTPSLGMANRTTFDSPPPLSLAISSWVRSRHWQSALAETRRSRCLWSSSAGRFWLQ